MFYRSQSELEQAHIASALVFELSKVETPHVRSAVVSHLLVIDKDLGQRVAKGLALTPCQNLRSLRFPCRICRSAPPHASLTV